MRGRPALSVVVTFFVLQVGACKRAETRCPPEAKLAGGKPPEASEEWCEIQGADGNPVKHGTYIAWYEDGHKQAQVEYENGKENGPTTVWYPSGKKMLEGTIRDGEREGVWQRWFESGEKQLETEFSGGKKNGRDRRWDEKGQLIADFQWKQDEFLETRVGPPPPPTPPASGDDSEAVPPMMRGPS